MQNRTKRSLALAAVVVLALNHLVWATGPAMTRITVPGMCCNGCVKKITAQMQAVPGVAQVQADLAARTVTIVPQQTALPSPRLMWEAVEKAGEKPAKLEGPTGTFTAKPQS
ncbi:MAG: heavy-metal-associated domain-containing protein [Gemmataceae bacterium]|nr:heavy-metal-associated domain-containing protein [Gemmataceae bacterium]